MEEKKKVHPLKKAGEEMAKAVIEHKREAHLTVPEAEALLKEAKAREIKEARDSKKEISVEIYDEHDVFIREYSLEVHGEKFRDLAEQFKNQNKNYVTK
jgi:hypothetical protein